jgi:hypothetical protein
MYIELFQSSIDAMDTTRFSLPSTVGHIPKFPFVLFVIGKRSLPLFPPIFRAAALSIKKKGPDHFTTLAVGIDGFPTLSRYKTY